ncbi:MAG: ferrochelatase [Gammaproteobacteria bacterium]|nr:ferrochelatase [Gammaproteobacteria bacterium]
MTISKDPNYLHGPQERIGILLVNLGSPEAPTPKALKKYLAEFLWDPRVVEIPRAIWWLVLHGFILRKRPAESAKLYQRVWTDQGSPLIATSMKQAQLIEKQLQKQIRGNILVDVAMRYGKPSITKGLRGLRKAGARRLLILPLYPQYSSTTTASVFDAVTEELRNWRWLPDMRFINSYHDNPGYINALAKSILRHWDALDRKPEVLLFSFHGIPKRYFENGDPYFCHCQKTARLVAEKLLLKDFQWRVVFQSRFGKEEWLQPYTDVTLKQLAHNGVKSVDIICPGFAADCLETLEEINMENREIFINRGGQEFTYIPALNDDAEHIQVLCDLIQQHSFGWPETMPKWDAGQQAVEANKTREKAIKMGSKA